MKLLTIVLALCVTTASHAQFIIEEDYYFSKANKPVSTKDSAYYYRETKRIPDDPDGLFSLREFYIKNGELKTSATIVHPTSEIDQWFIGDVYRYFPNGNLESFTKYDVVSKLVDTAYYFYDNKQLRHVVVYNELVTETKIDSTEFKESKIKLKRNKHSPPVKKDIIVTKKIPDIKHLFFYDKSGLMLVENGDGFIRFEDENGDYFEGALVNHKKDGQWRGWNRNSSYTENYSNDVFIQGERIFSDGSKKIYLPNAKETSAQYPGGSEELRAYIVRNLKISQNVFKERLLKSSYISFIVNEDGSLSDLNTRQETDLNVGKEIFAILKHGKKWIPASSQGVVIKGNVRVTFDYLFKEKPRELRERE